jgi:putative transposase
MARLPRLALAGHLHHVLHRGNNRQRMCADPADFEALHDAMRDAAGQLSVELHAYVLLPDHFHLLLTPPEATSLPLMMQVLGRRYARYFNDRHHRSGALWEGRYKSTVLQPERFGLAAMVFMDLHPVRAGLATLEQPHPWSSSPHYCGAKMDKSITPLPQYWSLGNTPFAREAAYARLLQEGVDTSQIHALTASVNRGWALGEPDFIDGLQRLTARRLRKAAPGRPAHAPESI